MGKNCAKIKETIGISDDLDVRELSYIPSTTAAAVGLEGVDEYSSPKQIVVAPPGEARTRVEGLLMFISVLINVDIAQCIFVGFKE